MGGLKLYLLTAGDVQDLGQLSEVSGHFLQQQLEAVPDNVHLLLGLQAVAALRVDQQLQRHVLKRGHLELRVQQLLADLLQGGTVIWDMKSKAAEELWPLPLERQFCLTLRG